MKNDPIKDRICENLAVLREHKGLTQGELAKELGSTQKSISSYERKRAFPKLDLLHAYMEFFNISYRDLSTKDLKEMSREEIDRLLNKKGKGTEILAITVGPDGEENIELVPVKAAAGYSKGYADEEYIRQLPHFRLPFLPVGTYRAFEIDGASMLPIQPGSVVVGRRIEGVEEVKKGDAYILVMEDGVVFKRVFEPTHEDKNHKLLLVSDNPAYEPFEVDVSDVQQIWKAYKVIGDMS
jgi:transcriptional regulator with XRE-family HTH domain